MRDELGEVPEVRGKRETGRAGEGMGEPEKYHVQPQEHREGFEQRGFTSDMDIDPFCVRMERASHEAIHGGGDWRLGRLWPKEWNRVMLSQSLPDGWPAVLEDANRFKVTKALGRWSAYMPEPHEECVRQASAVLLATPPPPGWRPLSPDDELLRTLLSEIIPVR